MKRKELEGYLQQLVEFDQPKITLEQYVTRPHIAACMLHTIHESFDDFRGKLVADLGCGCGMLSIGACMLGAGMCLGVDVDRDALDICLQNKTDMEINTLELSEMNVCSGMGTCYHSQFDTVIMNPPFGTKRNEGIDMVFLEEAVKVSSDTVYSLHKTTTRSYVLKKAKEWGVQAKVIAELRYDLPATYKFHKKESVDIQVDFFRFTHI